MIDTLIISSGGVMIFSLLGSMKYLYENKIIDNIKNYYGISAGAIICTMLALKYTSDEIIEFLIDLNIMRLIDDMDIDNIYNNIGLSKGVNRNIIIQNIISYKMGEDKLNYTFKELYNDTGINLNIYATCIEDKKLWNFSNLNNSDVPIWKALCASISIPIMFIPILINNNTFLDGAIINTYPINDIDYNKIKNCIGICYDNYDDNNYYNNYYINIYNILAKYKYQKFYKNTIRIFTPLKYKHYGLKFDLSLDEKNEIINIGFNITKNYFKLNNF